MVVLYGGFVCEHQGWPVELEPSSDHGSDGLAEIFPDLDLQQILTAKDGCLVLRGKLIEEIEGGADGDELVQWARAFFTPLSILTQPVPPCVAWSVMILHDVAVCRRS